MSNARIPKQSKHERPLPGALGHASVRRTGKGPRENHGMDTSSCDLGLNETNSSATRAGAAKAKPSAGVLVMSGPYVVLHKSEIIDLIRETAGGPERKDQIEPSIGITERPTHSIEFNFSTTQQARDIGRILYDRYGGELDVQVENDGTRVRILWWR